jgi:hypothetical protein
VLSSDYRVRVEEPIANTGCVFPEIIAEVAGMNLPSEIQLRAAGLPRRLKSVEDALKLIDGLPNEIAERPRWTFARDLLKAALISEKSRDLKTAMRQLQQAISNEKWS